jgi:hypothetical protein
VVNAIQPSFGHASAGSSANTFSAGFVAKISAAADVPLTAVTITSQAGVVLVDGSTRVDRASPHSFFWMPGSAHTVAVTGEMPAGTRGSFASWSDGGAASHIIVAPDLTSASLSAATMNLGIRASGLAGPAIVYEADFNNIQYQLRIEGSGVTVIRPEAGTVTISPSSPDGFYPAGTNLQLTATPAASWKFGFWDTDAPITVSDAQKPAISFHITAPARAAPVFLSSNP